MRIGDAASYRNVLANLGMLNERMENATMQVSSGKRLTRPSDSPSESAEVTHLKGQLIRIDQYRTNVDSGRFYLRIAETALSSVHDGLTAVFMRGSQAGSNFNDPTALAALASEIRAIRDQIFELANSHIQGRYLFAGSMVHQPAFAISGDTVSYRGDNAVNTVEISGGLQVEQNISGSAVFDPVFENIRLLLDGIDRDDKTAIQAALDRFKQTFAAVGTVRSRLGVELAKLENVEIHLQAREESLVLRKARIEDANMAEAISRINQTQAALNAAFQVGSLVRRRSLFDYLG